jgi:cytochrome c-type biogenesis protein CcmH/NrfG
MNGAGLSDSTAVAMLTPQVEVDTGVTWGLGIGLQDNEAGRAFWHWGDNVAYKAYALTFPEHGVGVVWFTNSENGQTILESMLAHAIALYREMKETQPPEAFDEYVLNTLGYRLLRSDRVQEAIAIFTLNVEEYPDAWNPYDSLGEAYVEAGELELAIVNYEKSVELNPENTNGIAALERLRAQVAER